MAFGPEKMLYIDVGKRQVAEKIISAETLRDTVGGAGLAIKLLLDQPVDPHMCWNDPQNPIILNGGPVSGTMIPGGGAYCLTTNGALTGRLASSQANGFWGAFLRSNGILGLYITGIAANWLHLVIRDGQVEFKDAGPLLGLDTYELAQSVEKTYGLNQNCISTTGIGPAGEHLVKFAAVFSDYGHVAAHNGVGAVFGTKRIKAITVIKGNSDSYVADPVRARAQVKELMQAVAGSGLHKHGTAANLSKHYNGGRLPVKNLTTNIWEHHSVMNGPALRNRFEAKVKPCWRCGLHARWITIPYGPYAGSAGDEPEYEGIAVCSSMIDNKDPEAMLVLSNYIDRQGLDVNETGWVIGWAMECYSRGLLKREFFDGLDLSWGNTEVVMDLVRKISAREGVGDFLAEGVKSCAESIGQEAYQCGVFTLKGNTPRDHDHRGNWHELLDTCLSDSGTILVTGGTADYAEAGVAAPAERFAPLEISRCNAQYSGRRQLEDCLVICRFVVPKFGPMIEMINAVTGWSLSKEEGLMLGRRSINRMRIYNILRGVTPEIEMPSPRYGSAPLDGPNEGTCFTDNFIEMRRDFWSRMGWSEDKGWPRPETLTELGLTELIPLLWT